jgi:pimeloyl-ACP methyl ester carboxylesterase
MLTENFVIHISDAEIDELRERIVRTRWPDEPDGAHWEYGTDLSFMRRMAAHWVEEFDWRRHERALNAFSNRIADIDGQRVHFIHEPGRGPRPMPLVITHGWPGSVLEMLEVIRPLADPAAFGGDPGDAFDVVVPSLPGFGFSSPRTARGPLRVDDLWARLMRGLGYDRFGAQGGDIGASVTTDLGRFHAERVVAIHLSSVDLIRPTPLPPDADLSPAELDFIRRSADWDEDEGAYSHVQRTRPQTLAYGLADSPVGLAAWIVEKFRAWSDCGGDVLSSFSLDELLANVSFYWFTNTMNSSMRAYYEKAHDPAPRPLPLGERVAAPAGIAMFPGETSLIVPREFAERCYDVRRWTDMPRGGHFAAFEEPDLFVEDVRAFFRDFR